MTTDERAAAVVLHRHFGPLRLVDRVASSGGRALPAAGPVAAPLPEDAPRGVWYTTDGRRASKALLARLGVRWR